MENQQSSLLSWVYYCQGKTIEELRCSLLYATFELEQTRMLVQEELKKRDDHLLQLHDLLNAALKERDEAQDKCQRLFLEKNYVLQQGVSETVEEEPRRLSGSNNNGFSSSDCEESIVSSFDQPSQVPPPPPPPPQCSSSSSSPEKLRIDLGFPKRPLPEKGKLLRAVLKAGPLLQTLLLAGPLPQWRHPPPQLESLEIPPISISSPPQLHEPLVNKSCGKVNRKRVLCDGSNSPRESKFQRVVYH